MDETKLEEFAPLMEMPPCQLFDSALWYAKTAPSGMYRKVSKNMNKWLTPDQKKRVSDARRRKTNRDAAKNHSRKRKYRALELTQKNDGLRGERQNLSTENNQLWDEFLSTSAVNDPDVKRFNKWIKERNLPPDMVDRLRKHRRQVKQRKYAKTSRRNKKNIEEAAKNAI
tara:strand:+ start:226 stop:735 length:510 start_codon:yes stop_codon:yes gene_type:complete